MDSLFGVWPIFLDPFIINLSIIVLGLLTLVLAIIEKLRAKRARLFEVSFLLFLAGFLFLTLHGKLLQLILPISLPEKPLVDNNLTFNYALASLLTYTVIPACSLIVLKKNVSLETSGLKIFNLKQTVIYTSLGLIFSILLYLSSYSFFSYSWVSEYTLGGLVLWVLLVSILSVFSESFFYFGLLFNRHLGHENGFLLAIISILAIQSYISASLPWVLMNIVGSAAKILITWKTRNIYGAALMGMASNLIDILIQIL